MEQRHVDSDSLESLLPELFYLNLSTPLAHSICSISVECSKKLHLRENIANKINSIFVRRHCRQQATSSASEKSAQDLRWGEGRPLFEMSTMAGNEMERKQQALRQAAEEGDLGDVQALLAEGLVKTKKSKC